MNVSDGSTSGRFPFARRTSGQGRTLPPARVKSNGRNRRRAALIALTGNLVPVKTPCTIRRTRRGTGSGHRHKGHDDPRRWRRLRGWLARAASAAATPPCGYGLSRNRQLLAAVTVTSNPPGPALTCVWTVRQLPKFTSPFALNATAPWWPRQTDALGATSLSIVQQLGPGPAPHRTFTPLPSGETQAGELVARPNSRSARQGFAQEGTTHRHSGATP
jgi:hypothetical protein